METSSSGRVPKFGIFETRLASSANVQNPFRDAALRAEFRAPSGQATAVEGFYAGENEWRVRFVPREHGPWTWTATLRAPGANVSTAGTFVCEGTDGHGFLRTSPRNPFRLEHEDGTPFYPIGIQTCNFLNPDFDGPAADGSWRSVSNDVWLTAFTGAVNLVRTQFGQGTREGCALALIPAPPKSAPGVQPETIPADRYDLDLAARIDAAYFQHRAAGMRQILILFQDMSLWAEGQSAFGSGRDLSPSGYKSVHAANLPAQEQYIRYIVARWGCFVDVWELFNEDAYHGHGDIRTSALSNGRVTAVYLHHFADHASAFELPHHLGVQTGPGRFRLRWIDPEDGRQVLDEERTTLQQFLMFRPPPVTVDMACTIRRLDDAP